MPIHLYIHVPFCARRCSYCDFAIAVRRTIPAERFVERVGAEWALWLDHPVVAGAGGLATIYLGGGTPSLLDPAALVRLLDAIERGCPRVPGAEVTLEANPEDVTAVRARAWRQAGVTRVSLGVQSFDSRVLAWMHRVHPAEQAGRAVAALREAGFENLSLDLIFGVPPELARDWARDLELALALEPAHLSLYGLTVEPHTPLARWIARGRTRPAPDERHAEEFLLADARLRAAGFEHYEVSNYARPGFRAVHNAAYWSRGPYVGLGPSAHSAFGDTRQWNRRDWASYERALARGESPVEGREALDPEAQRLEALYLGLRTDRGVPLDLIPVEVAQRWVSAGWAWRAGDRIRLSAEGWLRLDALAVQSA
jgi:oxygen-independent coproporphyrinogen-3 oxidase